jgi:hypothetical protein
MRNLFCLLTLLAATAAMAASTNTSVLNWNAVTTDTSGNPLANSVTYNVLASYTGATGTYSQIATSLTTTTYTDSSASLVPGSTACYEVTATAGGVTSAASNSACKTFPFPTPSAPSGLTVK